MDHRKPLLKHLVALEKERSGSIARTRGIIKAADKLEKQAMKDIRRYAGEVQSSTDPRRKIAEADYLDAIDRRRKAGQAGAMARQTLTKLGA